MNDDDVDVDDGVDVDLDKYVDNEIDVDSCDVFDKDIGILY